MEESSYNIYIDCEGFLDSMECNSWILCKVISV